MTFLRLLRSEFTRLTSGFIPLITIAGLSIIPLLYAGVYLYANWDPYDNLEGIDAALVNLDESADFDGEERTIGDDVVSDLVEDGTFGWHEIDDREAAIDGVETGQYGFALIIPEGFSEALASPSSFESAEQATLEITVNEANNYLLTNIVNVMANEVHDAVAQQVGEETADAILTGFGRIHQQLLEAADGASQLQDGSSDLQDGLGELHEGATELSAGAAELNTGTDELVNGIGPLATGAQQLRSGAGELSNGAWQLHSGLDELVDGGQSLQSAAGQLNEGAGTLANGLGELSDGAAQVADGNEQLAAATDEATDVLTEVEQSTQNSVDEAVNNLIDSGLVDDSDIAEVEEALSSLADDSDIAQRAGAAREELASAHAAIDQLAAGAREVSTGADELSAGASTLHSGTGELVNQLPSLVDGLEQAQSGASQLGTGADDLSDGAGQLVDGVGTLATGANELSAGANALAEGSVTLTDGVGEAQDGAGELTDGAGELASGLDDGAEEVPDPDERTQQEISQVMGNPVNVNQVTQNEAGNYGAGMAPFFLSLSLWIGALVLVQVLRPVNPRALASSVRSTAIAAGSWLPFAGLALGQSLLLYAAVTLGLDLTPSHPLLTVTLLGAAAFAFSAVTQASVALLGNPGKMLMLILLVLQLVSSGGMFPQQTLPPALEALHPFLPMTYVVDGLRHSIYGGEVSSITQALLAMLVVTLGAYLVQVFAAHRNKMWSLKRLQPPIQEAA